MVFESVLTQVLNRFLGAYIENLDTNQLKVGIWGGDVELNNLVLKQSALDDLDLPVQTIYGQIGKLFLKIPWKNLYGSAFVINIEDIYLLASPNEQVKYDEKKEHTMKIEVKKKQIMQVEFAKKQAAEKDKPKADSSFVEKLITQIIKNIQLNIKNIHIRYEDKVTSPNPFSVGITLSRLEVVSTDENWQPAITKEDITKIYKIVNLDGLALYWNCNSSAYSGFKKVDLLDTMLKDIAARNCIPDDYAYVVGPINASARLRINQKPELDQPAYSLPQVHLNVNLEKLFIGITKAQYQDIIALTESMDRMTKGIPFRKYRPDVPYCGHYKKWWHFAYICVLESEVQRKRKNWDWTHILNYRNICKDYGKLYEKILLNTATEVERKKLEECEQEINIVNLVIIRQTKELETERRVKKLSQERRSFIGWMWGSKTTSGESTNSDDKEIRQQLQDAMSKEEKERLYEAIGYQENAAPTHYPKSFVDKSFTFVLRTLELEVCDDFADVPQVLFTELKGVRCRMDTRAEMDALKVHVKIDEFTTFGLQQDDFVPNIITSETGGGDSALLEVLFETNPLEGNYGQRLHLTAQPLKIVYDAQTIIKAVDIFRIPPSSALDQISAAADSGLMNIKEMSTTGLQHAIDSHVKLDLKIDLKAPYIILPYGGKYTDNENVLVVNLGTFQMSSLDRPEGKDLRQLHAAGLSEKAIFEQLIAQSYDQFQIKLTSVQVMIAQTDEDWKSRIKDARSSDMHILEPVNLKLNISQCLISDDPKLPLTKISGELPSIVVNVSDARLLLLIALGTSIPLPTSDVPESKPLEHAVKTRSSVMLKYLEIQETAQKTKDKSDPLKQFTTLEMNFVMTAFSLNLKHQEDLKTLAIEVASFNARYLEFDFMQQTYNSRTSLRLASIELAQNYQTKELRVISTPRSEKRDQYLFEITFVQVDKHSPEFHSTYASCESNLTLTFEKLDIILHKEALLEVIQFATILQTDIQDCWSDNRGVINRVASSDSIMKRQLSTISEGISGQIKTAGRKGRETGVKVETILFKLNAGLQELAVEFTTEEAPISRCALTGIRANIIVKTPYTQINASLNQISVHDLNVKTIHKLILSVSGQDALGARVVLFNLNKNVESDKPDISVDVTLGCWRIVFLHWFISRMLNDFLNEFQTAQAAIIEASQAAAKSAKENMQHVYAQATKLSLNIDLKAPEIIVPQNSSSADAVLLDLGHISISNQFVTLEIKNEQNFSAVIDNMKLNLTNLKISRIILQNNQVIDELPLLVPVTFKITVKRNLSSSWYKAVPEIDIIGRIFSITLLMSKVDYKTILLVLNENLAEGQKTSPGSQSKGSQAVDPTGEMPGVQEALQAAASQRFLADAKESKTNTFLRCTFTMDNLLISLFTGGSQKFSSDSHSAQEGLARFSLEGISLKCRILSDDSIIASVLLLNCFLDDMRKSQQDKLTRLIERSRESGYDDSVSQITSTSDSLSPRSMIDVVVQMKDKNVFTDIKIYSFTLILSVDYLTKLMDFLRVPPSDIDEQKPNQAIESAKSSYVGRSPSQEVESESQITVNLKVEKPDIILVEHMDNIDTQALILNSEVVVKLRLTGSHQVINGSITDLQVYTCSYNPSKRAETRNNVLHPVTISLAGSTPEDKGLHVELLVTNIRLGVSPSTIELLSRVVATATGGGTVANDDEETMMDHSHVWDVKPFIEKDFWFFRIDEAIECTENSVAQAAATLRSPRSSREMCIVSVPSIKIVVEAGVGNKTLPMLIIESSLKGTISNWSSQLGVDTRLALQTSYYNSRLAVWEPLIEPIEVMKNGTLISVPWELKMEVSMSESEDVTSPTDVDSAETVQMPQPVMSIDVTSANSLELTVTKTCLEVLSNLGKAFAMAITPHEVKMIEEVSPYKVVNELGCSVTINLRTGSFSLFSEKSSADVILKSGAEVAIQRKSQHYSRHATAVKITESLDFKTCILKIKVNEKNCDLDLPVFRADRRFFSLNYRDEGNDTWGIISDVQVDEGTTVIILRSILQVHNHFNIPVEVYYMTAKGNELACITTVQPDSKVNVPLNAVYTPTKELFFGVEGHSVTTAPYIWKDLQTNLTVTKILHCSPKNTELISEAFIIRATGEMEQVYYENTNRHTMSSTCYNIHLRPTVIFKNCLPVQIVFCDEKMVSQVPIEPGKKLMLPNVDPGKAAVVVRLPDYLEKEWSSRQELLEKLPEFSVWTFNSYDSIAQMTINLGMHTINENGTVELSLYCPFWMLNKTGLALAYRNSDEVANMLHHPANFKGPILFSFNIKNFFGKKKAAVRVEQGDWSDKFSIDVAASSGVVTCKYNDMLYQIGVHNQLTYNGLTKQITFTPYYVVINNAAFAIECQENDRPADPWIIIEPHSCTPLWPKSELDDRSLRLKVQGTEEISASFLYTESHTSLLKLKNKFGGINVDIQIIEGAIYINFAPYESGTPAALIINHTKDTMNFWEKDTVQIRNLPSKHSMLYTWENPSGPRILSWEGAHKKEHSNDLCKDGIGQYSLSDDYQIYWVSFLDGMQRVLLLTQNECVAQNAEAANLFEVIQQEINVSICGIGFSLVNNINRQEIMYVGIASSGIIWEECKINGRRFKHMSGKESTAIEAAYQRHLIDLGHISDVRSEVTVDSKTQVDFQQGRMFKPHKRRIRRTFQTGLWLQLKTSPSQLQVHAKINRLQIDNQMYDCIFPVVLAPVPVPKSVAIDSGVKPFAELSIVQLLMKNSQTKQFKYFKLLIQEFHVKVDLGFVNALVDMFQSAEYSDEEEQQLFLKDVGLVDEPLFAHASTQSLLEQKSFYDLLHFSPLKIHISFSLAAGSSATKTLSTPNFVNVLLQGVGVTLTDLQDVVLKLAYFEREYSFLTQKQLVGEAKVHYVGQAVKQLYVLVLGLDVIGNPYGLVRGITQGVEDLFYEPFQGAIQGPGEFAEGLALGVKSLFGHTVGGAAGAVSRITGAMGKGIAVLTFDKDYQRKRRDQINKKPATVQEGIARSGKGLVMGVVDGVTGVFTKPISGAKEEGVGGFFKGLGKGAVGLVTRPTAGVVDFASGSLDAVKRVAEFSEEVSRLRRPRFLQSDGLVTPFNKHDAQGNKLLIDLEKGKYATTDIYVSHYIIIEKKEVLLLTDKRITFITHNDLFGGWQVEWAYTWPELKHPPSVVPRGVAITTSDKKKKLNLFGSNDVGKIILIKEPHKCEEICAKIESLRGNA